MSYCYCINPKCQQRNNPDHLNFCSTCDTPLRIKEQYRLVEPLRELNERGNAEVFVAIDDKAGTEKVLKVLQNPKLLEMFKREAQTLQRMRHPGIPCVKSDGYFSFVLNENSGKELHCLVMEKIEGQNLEQWLKQNKPINQALALKWLRELTKILGMLHQNDLFHRDIKLSNIMLKSDGQLVLIDFGTIREMTVTYHAKMNSNRELTSIVSPGYSPLELMNGKGVPQSDFYALGRCLVHLLTNVHPLDLPANGETGKLLWRDSAPQVSTWLADLIDDLIAPFPANRPSNTQEILERLETEKVLPLLKQSWRRNPSLKWLVLNIVLLVFNLISLFVYNNKPFTKVSVEAPSSKVQVLINKGAKNSN